MLRRAKNEIYRGWKGENRFRYYRQLLRNERLNSEEMMKLQWRKLKAIVRHAYDQTDYYRQTFQALGFHPEDLSSLTDLGKLPLLTRERIRENRDRMLSRTAVVGSYFAHSTGGSTGEPLDFYRGHDYNELSNLAAGYRSAHRAGWNPGERMALIWDPRVAQRMELPAGRLARFRRRVGEWARDEGWVVLSAFDAAADRMNDWVAVLRRTRPRHIMGYASALANFASFLESRREQFNFIRGAISTGETLYPAQRELLRRVFGGVVIDRYGSREICAIATSCPHGGMHINNDLCFVEFLDSGERGAQRIVVTDLENRVFPFIRYEIGDCGSADDRPCECGLPFPCMSVEVGRFSDHFISPEGRLTHGLYFKNVMDGVPGVASFQFRQVSREQIVLSIVKGRGFGAATKHFVDGVRAAIGREFSARTELLVRYVGAIPLTSGGKHRFVVSELRQIDRPERDPLEAGAAPHTSCH